MAINQQPTQRTIGIQGSEVSSGTGLTSLASATSALSQVITERINDVAIEQAGVQGQNDVLDGKAPEKLSLPFTKATKAYNNAVANTEARRQAISAHELIQESLANNTNPATFNSGSPANLKAELQGIKEGVLQHSRPETRAALSNAIDAAAANANVAMLKHSIEYDNKRMDFDFKHDLNGLIEARRDASIAGDVERIKGIDSAIDATVHDYSEMNQQIKQQAPYIKDDIERVREVDKVLSDFSDALANGTQGKYLSDLADNKQNLPYKTWNDSVKAVVALDQQHSRLKNDVNAEQNAQVDLGIENGTITSPEDLLNYPELTTAQVLTKMKAMKAKEAQKVKDNAKVITAQQNILSGRPEWNTADTKNAMFKDAIGRLEQATGQPATLKDMEESIMGTNQFPASGMPGTPMGVNVPAFDSTISQKLTSQDPIQTAQAAMVYNHMANVIGKPNSINLTGDSLAVATLFNEINTGGTPPEDAASQAITKVLNATEPQVAQRIEMFNKNLAHIDPSTGKNNLMIQFKDAFKVDPQAFGSSEAFRVFSDKYRNYYLTSNSQEAALNATKYDMRHWGTSEYFDKGFVGQPVPEKELPITQIGNAFGNQMVASLQGFINRNNAMRAEHPELGIPLVEWADQKQTITGNESQQDKVFKKFAIGNKPRLKVNGQETDVVLMPSASSQLDNRVNYLFGVYDQFNNLSPLKDVSNGVDQVARFAPTELSIWAPSVATANADKELRSIADKVSEKETKKIDKKELDALNRTAPPWLSMLGLAGGEEHRAYIERRAGRTDKGRIEKIIQSLKDAGSGTTRDQITNADNVGISQDLISTGNIDLSTRPRVKRANGKTSTVDSIGIEQDGKHYVIPQISDDGEVLTPKEAIDLFHKTGKHLGVFKTQKAADKFAQKLHESEAKKIKGNE